MNMFGILKLQFSKFPGRSKMINNETKTTKALLEYCIHMLIVNQIYLSKVNGKCVSY